MSKEKLDPASFGDHDDDAEITDDDLGSTLESEEEDAEADAAAPAKKPSAEKGGRKKGAEEEADEEEESEEEAEEGEEAPPAADERAKLAKKLARAGRAREALENQLREAQALLQQQQDKRSDASRAKFDKLMEELDGLYEQVEEFRARGESKEASKAQRRIDDIRDNLSRSQAAMFAARETMQQVELRAYNTMVRELESLDPRFDPDHDDFDEELLNDVGELVESYEAKGMLSTDALRKACKVMLREDVFSKAKSLKRAPKAAHEPRKTDVERNLKTARRQPAEEPGTRGERASELPNMATISEADYDALPESTLRRILDGEAS